MSRSAATSRQTINLASYSTRPLDTAVGEESKYYQRYLSLGVEEPWFFVLNAKLIWMWKKMSA